MQLISGWSTVLRHARHRIYIAEIEPQGGIHRGDPTEWRRLLDLPSPAEMTIMAGIDTQTHIARPGTRMMQILRIRDWRSRPTVILIGTVIGRAMHPATASRRPGPPNMLTAVD